MSDFTPGARAEARSGKPGRRATKTRTLLRISGTGTRRYARRADPDPNPVNAPPTIDSGRCLGLKGKAPEATVAMLAVGLKPGGPLTPVDKVTYVLADAVAKS